MQDPVTVFKMLSTICHEQREEYNEELSEFAGDDIPPPVRKPWPETALLMDLAGEVWEWDRQPVDVRRRAMGLLWEQINRMMQAYLREGSTHDDPSS